MKKIEAIRRNAEVGKTNAQAELGWLYDQGRGVKNNLKQAFRWYLKAAKGGNRVAQYKVSCSDSTSSPSDLWVTPGGKLIGL